MKALRTKDTHEWVNVSGEYEDSYGICLIPHLLPDSVNLEHIRSVILKLPDNVELVNVKVIVES